MITQLSQTKIKIPEGVALVKAYKQQPQKAGGHHEKHLLK